MKEKKVVHTEAGTGKNYPVFLKDTKQAGRLVVRDPNTCPSCAICNQ